MGGGFKDCRINRNDHAKKESEGVKRMKSELMIVVTLCGKKEWEVGGKGPTLSASGRYTNSDDDGIRIKCALL